MTLTLSSILPYLLTIGIYLLGHYQAVPKLLSLVGLAAGPNPLVPGVPASKTLVLPNHPILSDAVNAAIQKGVADATAGHIASLKDELVAVAKAAAEKAVADTKAKV